MQKELIARNPRVSGVPSRARSSIAAKRWLVAFGVTTALSPACASSRTQPTAVAAQSVLHEAEGVPEASSTAQSAPPRGGHDQVATERAPREFGDLERELAGSARLATIERVALERNPELSEAAEQVRAARELAPAASRLPEPELEYQLWAQPLRRPYALDEAQMHMFGLRQTIPAPGSLGARSDAAAERATVLAQTRVARERELIARVRRAYAEYYRADREYRVHFEHVEIAQRVLDLARATYQAGRGSQQDVLRTVVELSRLHNGLAGVERERQSARALLNTLMARPVDAPLGPPEALLGAGVQVRFEELSRALFAHRPEIAAAESSVRMRERELDAARSSSRWPSFMIGVQYMYMPPMMEPHNYGVTLSMTLPWLNPRYGEEVRAAEATVAAEQSALASTRNTARYELYDAVQRLHAAQESFVIIERDLLPQARQSFESIQAAYRGAQGDSLSLLDALRALLDVRIERERALARLEAALADVERAAGVRVGSAVTGEKP